jgi:hypothetical protein
LFSLERPGRSAVHLFREERLAGLRPVGTVP